MGGWAKESVKCDLTSFTLPLVSNSGKIFDGVRCENECFHNYLWISVIRMSSILFLACPCLYYLYSPPSLGK